MGHPVPPEPPEPEYGDDCPECTPALFEPGKTPKYVNIVFQDIEKCWHLAPEPPNDHLFILTQNLTLKCRWWIRETINGTTFDVFWLPRYTDTDTRISLYDRNDLTFYFEHRAPPTCWPPNHSLVSCQLVCSGFFGPWGAGGTAKIWWPGGEINNDAIATLLAHDYNFLNVPGAKYEAVPPTGTIASHFFANTSNRVKCYIQYDLSELE